MENRLDHLYSWKMGDAMNRFTCLVSGILCFFLNTGFAQTTADSAKAPATETSVAPSGQPATQPVSPASGEQGAPAVEAPKTENAQSAETAPAVAPETPNPPERKEAAAEEPKPAPETAAPAATAKPAEKPAEKNPSAEPDKLTYELSAGSVTVNDQQWTRIAFGVDVPLWKFGIFFDIEAFLDQQGNFSNKGWDFRNDPLDAVMRKIRYVRFGHETEPLFVKVGGLSNVTIGHGFIVDRFTNMLHYPDQKLLGAQFYLNDITPLGLTVQAMAADLRELRGKYDGGVGALRLAVKPLKMTSLPLLDNLSVGGAYAMDRNTYAPARDWTRSDEQRRALMDSMFLTDAQKQIYRDSGFYNDSALAQLRREDAVKNLVRPFGIYGVDLNLPLITTSLLSLDVYAQSGMRDDSVTGWGFGAPGVALTVWRLNASVEYRHVEGRFTPGFFDPYYLDERLTREPSIKTKADLLDSATLNGVFGRLGFDIANVLLIDGGYQYMKGSTDNQKDQRFELTGNIGSMILSKIPKIKKLEAYLYKTHVGSDISKYDTTGTPVLTNGKYIYDGFFEKTPFLYYGYRLGFEISQGATLICDTRFGYTRDGSGKLAPRNNVSVMTAFSF
jgi:hypothetical protein